MRKPLKFRAVGDLSRPTPTRTALKPESCEGRRNQRLCLFGRPKKRQSRTLRQANWLRRHWNRNPVVALKQLPRDGRSGKSRRPAILEYGPSPRLPKSDILHLDPSQKSAIQRSGGVLCPSHGGCNINVKAPRAHCVETISVDFVYAKAIQPTDVN